MVNVTNIKIIFLWVKYVYPYKYFNVTNPEQPMDDKKFYPIPLHLYPHPYILLELSILPFLKHQSSLKFIPVPIGILFLFTLLSSCLQASTSSCPKSSAFHNSEYYDSDLIQFFFAFLIDIHSWRSIFVFR